MLIIKIILISFIGYLIGRIGDYYAGHWDFFHHWIYGVFFVLFGIAYGFLFLFFGVGLIISDLKDMLKFEIYGPDKKDKKNFWGID